MSVKKISISFRRPDLDVYEYVKQQDNVSALVVRAIRAYMERPDSLDSLEHKVEVIVKQLLQSMDLQPRDATEAAQSQEESLSESDRDLLNSLF